MVSEFCDGCFGPKTWQQPHKDKGDDGKWMTVEIQKTRNWREETQKMTEIGRVAAGNKRDEDGRSRTNKAGWKRNRQK